MGAAVESVTDEGYPHPPTVNVLTPAAKLATSLVCPVRSTLNDLASTLNLSTATVNDLLSTVNRRISTLVALMSTVTRRSLTPREVTASSSPSNAPMSVRREAVDALRDALEIRVVTMRLGRATMHS